MNIDNVYLNMESAITSQRPINYFPASDGKVYEVLKNEIGIFIVPTKDVKELDHIETHFIATLPLVPFSLLQQIISFFRSFLDKKDGVEAVVLIYWDKEDKKYIVDVPQQTAKRHCVKYICALNDELKKDRYVYIMDIHSHRGTYSDFSRADDYCPRGTSLYAVVGGLNDYFPWIKVRIKHKVTCIDVTPSAIFEDVGTVFPIEWRKPVYAVYDNGYV